MIDHGCSLASDVSDGSGSRSGLWSSPVTRVAEAALASAVTGGCLGRSLAGSSGSVHLVEVWRKLLSGELRVAHCGVDERSFSIAVTRATPPAGPRAERAARNLSLLERSLLGAAQKELAADFGLTLRSVAAALNDGLGSLGLRCRPSRPPAMLVVLASAASRSAGPLLGCVERRGGEGYEHIHVPRFDDSLSQRLPQSEFLVMRALIEGGSHAEIAALRGASRSTVANQLSIAFGRLRVSGRTQLILHLLEASGAEQGWRAPVARRAHVARGRRRPRSSLPQFALSLGGAL